MIQIVKMFLPRSINLSISNSNSASIFSDSAICIILYTFPGFTRITAIRTHKCRKCNKQVINRDVGPKLSPNWARMSCTMLSSTRTSSEVILEVVKC